VCPKNKKQGQKMLELTIEKLYNNSYYLSLIRTEVFYKNKRGYEFLITGIRPSGVNFLVDVVTEVGEHGDMILGGHEKVYKDFVMDLVVGEYDDL
jgi:hypothetical protein